MLTQAGSEPMDAKTLDYEAVGLSKEDLASTEDKWNQFIHEHTIEAASSPPATCQSSPLSPMSGTEDLLQVSSLPFPQLRSPFWLWGRSLPPTTASPTTTTTSKDTLVPLQEETHLSPFFRLGEHSFIGRGLGPWRLVIYFEDGTLTLVHEDDFPQSMSIAQVKTLARGMWGNVEEDVCDHVALLVDDVLACRSNLPATWYGGNHLPYYHYEYLRGLAVEEAGGLHYWQNVCHNQQITQTVRATTEGTRNLPPCCELGVIYPQVITIPMFTLALHLLAEDIDCFPKGPESNSGLLCVQFHGMWVIICSLNNCYYHLCVDGPDYLTLIQSSDCIDAADWDEILRQFHEVYMGNWCHSSDADSLAFKKHAAEFFVDCDNTEVIPTTMLIVTNS